MRPQISWKGSSNKCWGCSMNQHPASPLFYLHREPTAWPQRWRNALLSPTCCPSMWAIQGAGQQRDASAVPHGVGSIVGLNNLELAVRPSNQPHPARAGPRGAWPEGAAHQGTRGGQPCPATKKWCFSQSKIPAPPHFKAPIAPLPRDQPQQSHFTPVPMIVCAS